MSNSYERFRLRTEPGWDTITWKNRLHSRMLQLYIKAISKTVKVTWTAPIPGQRALWICWHEDIVALFAAFVATSPKYMPSAVGWKNKRGTTIRIALQHFGTSVLQISTEEPAGSNKRHIVNQLKSVNGGCLIAADGPVGPRRITRSPVEQLAQEAGVQAVWIGCEYRRVIRLPRWDKIAIPFPFSTIIVQPLRQ